MEKSNDPGKISPDLIKMVENVVSKMGSSSSKIPSPPPPPPHSSPSVPPTSEPMDINKIFSMATQLLQSEEGVTLKNLVSNAIQTPKSNYCEEKGCPEEKESLTDVLSPLIKSVMDQMNEGKKKREEKSKMTSSALTSCLMDCCRMGMETKNERLQAFCFIEKISLFSKMYLAAMTMDQSLPSESLQVLRSELSSQFSNVLKQLDPCVSSLPHPD